MKSIKKYKAAITHKSSCELSEQKPSVESTVKLNHVMYGSTTNA